MPNFLLCMISLMERPLKSSRTMAMLNMVACLLILHVLVVGWLIGRWLLVPMSRLNRQVEALARDAPPHEPLLTSPPEMAALAVASGRSYFFGFCVDWAPKKTA